MKLSHAGFSLWNKKGIMSYIKKKKKSLAMPFKVEKSPDVFCWLAASFFSLLRRDLEFPVTQSASY